MRDRLATFGIQPEWPRRGRQVHVGDMPATVLSSYAHLLPQSDEIAAERVAAALSA